MYDNELLDNIKELVSDFSWWDEEAYLMLIYRNCIDFEYDLPFAYKVTNLLDKIYEYARIIDFITLDEIEELINYVGYDKIDKLKDCFEISLLCSKYIQELEEDESLIKHPVYTYYDSKDFMYQTEDMFYQTLATYITETNNNERNQILETMNKIEVLSIYHYEEYFEEIIKPEIKLVLDTATKEQVIGFLVNYVIEKEERENGSFTLISEAKSEMMAYLYNNYYNHGITVNEIYEELEYYYLQNKNYLGRYRQMVGKVNKYKEKCNKL